MKNNEVQTVTISSYEIYQKLLYFYNLITSIFFYFYFFFSDTETLYPFLIMICKLCFLFLLLEMLFSDGKGTALTTYLQLPARLNQGGSQLIVTFNM